MKPPNIPRPTYEYDIDELTKAYRVAVTDIQAEMALLDVSSLSRKTAGSALAQVSNVLKTLTQRAFEWIARLIPKAATDGIIRTLISLGIAKDRTQAAGIATLNRMNQNVVAAAVADTQADVLAVTANIDRRTRAALRKAVAESMRANMAKGINGSQTISADTVARIRADLGAAADNAIIDAAGRKWRVETYVDMLTRTKLMNVHNEATINEALGRDVYYGVISKHGAKDACSKWEGRVIKFVAEAPGDYPLLSALPRRDIFHPNCRHVISPIRRPETLTA
ncbi:phage minor capsid protein [Paenibacillus agricola]|uniref:Minor capsid protein n=1 Tax=Paenibacillus agricola TaxID=2716264 RepID=A0ABX0J8F0_9BACL|nr:phage minor capsid protein [Paenibacillus agricola]NHN31137.1 minor capsid protein [Paenibacillus agricola]